MDLAFIDANIPIYAAVRPSFGTRVPTSSVLFRAIRGPSLQIPKSYRNCPSLLSATDVARYWQENVRSFCLHHGGRIEPMFAQDVQRAAELTDVHPIPLGPRSVHLAVMEAGARQRSSPPTPRSTTSTASSGSIPRTPRPGCRASKTSHPSRVGQVERSPSAEGHGQRRLIGLAFDA
jgi:hypothetical protein